MHDVKRYNKTSFKHNRKEDFYFMESRIKKTIELHDKGYNCAQAVACAYCDLVGVDEKTALCATEAFGAGMGGLQATCGAVSGAVFLAGMKNADGNVDAPKSKGATYKLSKSIVEAFQKKNGTIICKELKAINPETGCATRSCDGCIMDAAAIAEVILFSE